MMKRPSGDQSPGYFLLADFKTSSGSPAPLATRACAVVAAVAFSVDQYECLIGQKTGWNCLFADLGPKVAAMCLLPPIGGLLWRGWRRWRAPAT